MGRGRPPRIVRGPRLRPGRRLGMGARWPLRPRREARPGSISGTGRRYRAGGLAPARESIRGDRRGPVRARRRRGGATCLRLRRLRALHRRFGRRVATHARRGRRCRRRGRSGRRGGARGGGRDWTRLAAQRAARARGRGLARRCWIDRLGDLEGDSGHGSRAGAHNATISHHTGPRVSLGAEPATQRTPLLIGHPCVLGCAERAVRQPGLRCCLRDSRLHSRYGWGPG